MNSSKIVIALTTISGDNALKSIFVYSLSFPFKICSIDSITLNVFFTTDNLESFDISSKH